MNLSEGRNGLRDDSSQLDINFFALQSACLYHLDHENLFPEGYDSLDSHVELRNLKAPWLQSAIVEKLKQK